MSYNCLKFNYNKRLPRKDSIRGRIEAYEKACTNQQVQDDINYSYFPSEIFLI